MNKIPIITLKETTEEQYWEQIAQNKKVAPLKNHVMIALLLQDFTLNKQKD